MMVALASIVASAAEVAPVAYRLQLDVVSAGFDGETCWFHPRAGAIPGPTPTVVLTMQKWWLKQSDVFLPVIGFALLWLQISEQRKSPMMIVPQPAGSRPRIWWKRRGGGPASRGQWPSY